MFMNFIMVFIGGGIGCVLRFMGNNLFARFFNSNLYLSTFTVNFIGSLILGFVFIFFTEKSSVSPALKYAITVGFCGGLTTFSTFSLEIFEMIKNGNISIAIVYSLLSIIVCITAIAIGAMLARHMFS